MPRQLLDRSTLLRAEINRLDETSRTRALTDKESSRLQSLIYRESYASYQLKRQGAA